MWSCHQEVHSRYDENGGVNFTVVSDNNKVKLPENGTVVFAGAPNSEFYSRIELATTRDRLQ